MKLDYGTLLSPLPIELSIGSIRQPTLRDIRKLGFDNFIRFKTFMKITPEIYYTKIVKDGQEIWDSFPEEKQDSITIYEILKTDETLQKLYEELFNYYFIEKVEYIDELFVIYNEGFDRSKLVDVEGVRQALKGVISEKTFKPVLEVLQQICRIYDFEDEEEEPVFKSKKAKAIYEKIKAAEREKKQKQAEKESKHLTMPNIISVVGNYHPTINPITVWDLTVFMLYDAFERLRIMKGFSSASISIAVWGDEKNKFDQTSWYHNIYDSISND